MVEDEKEYDYEVQAKVTFLLWQEMETDSMEDEALSLALSFLFVCLSFVCLLRKECFVCFWSLKMRNK